MLLKTTLNGSGREIKLGQRTLIVGPTGSGKTSILASIGLALTGRADDLAGRDSIASGTELALAMPESDSDDDPPAEFSVVLDPGEGTEQFRYGLRVGSRPAQGATDPWRHPLRMLRDSLRGEVARARANLASWAFAAPVPLARMLPHNMGEDQRFKALLGREFENPSVEQLAKAVDTVKAEARKRKTAGDDDERAAAALERGLATPPSPEQLAVAEMTAKVLREKVGGIANQQAQQIELTRLRARATEIEALVQDRVKLFTEAKARVDQIGDVAPPSAADEQLRAKRVLFDSAVGFVNTAMEYRRGLGQPIDACPTCGAPTTEAALTARRDAVNGALAQLDSQSAAITQQVALARTRREYVAAIERIKAEHAALVAEYGQIGEQLKAIDVTGFVDPGDLLKQLTSAEQTAAAMGATANSWDRVRRLRAQAQDHHATSTWFSALVAELNHAIDRIYEERTSELEMRVAKYLPADHGLVLRLRAASGRPTLRLGLGFPDGTVSYNPSGGQRSALYLALTCALLDMGALPVPKDGPVVVMLPEERGMSPEWLRDVMVALSTSTATIVLASLHGPKGRKIKGWDIIELPEFKSADAAPEAPPVEPAVAPVAVLALAGLPPSPIDFTGGDFPPPDDDPPAYDYE